MENILLLLFPLILAACATTTAIGPITYLAEVPETAPVEIATDSATDIPLELNSPTDTVVSSRKPITPVTVTDTIATSHPPTPPKTVTDAAVSSYPPTTLVTVTDTAVSPYPPPNSATVVPATNKPAVSIANPTAYTYIPIIAKPPQTFYVSKRGSNGDGKSWFTAWNELDQIDWGVVQPGDTILLDGGTTEMVYTTVLQIQTSGSSAQPITIMLANEAGRDGKVVIFGGRSTPLPYCGQLDYSYETEGVRNTGLIIDDISWVRLDGLKWGGITIHGHNGRGVRLFSGANNVTVRNIEIYDNGLPGQISNGEWRPNLAGVGLSGSDITFDRALIHDNGQDAFQSMSGENNIANFTIKRSWLHNSRKHPTLEETFNYCRHTDGVQIYDGGVVSGVTIEESVIGPGFTQGIILGQTENEHGSSAIVNDVTLRNTVFAKAKGINIVGYNKVKSQRWIIENVTSHCPTGYTSVCLWLEGADHTIIDSIFSGSNNVLPDGIDTYSGNCQWDNAGFEFGQNVDPLFTDVNDDDPFSLDDYSLQADSPCQGKGSSITSVDQLLSIP